MKKIIEFIPGELNEIVDYQEIGNAIDQYHADKIAQLQQLKLNQDILSADEETIAKLEKRMGIIPRASESLEERRYRCWIKQTAHTPFTEQWLRHWLRDFIGYDNYDLDFNYEARTFILKITLSNQSNYEAIALLLDEVVPTKIQYLLTYLYNTWQDAYENHNWEDISNYTWEQAIKNEDFKGA